MKPSAVTVALFCFFALTACAGHPVGMMQPIGASVPQTHTVDMLVATNRKPDPRPGVFYSGERGQSLALSDVVVSIPPDENRTAGQVQWPHAGTPDPNKDFATVGVEPLSLQDASAWIDHLPADRRKHLLIFVHGFNTPYDTGIYLYAQLLHDARLTVAPAMFSWPSRGKTLAYAYDRESATVSRTALADLLEAAAANDQVEDVTVLAHSMGSWLTMEALRTIALRHGGIPAKINNVLLASPDIDVDVFFAQFLDLGATHPNITLLISQDDRALRLSRLLGGNVDRLGAVDFGKEPYTSADFDKSIRVIDMTDLKGHDATHHLKFSERADVAALVEQMLANGQILSEDRTTLSEKLGVLVIAGSRTTVQKIEDAKPH